MTSQTEMNTTNLLKGTQSEQRKIVLDLITCLALVVAATILYSSLFLHVPVLTEVRHFLSYQGWGAKLSDVLVPTGSDYRPLSWVFFAWQHRVFPFNAEAVNLVQFVLLGLGAVFVYIHMCQLSEKRTAALTACILWLISLPAIDAAFWQATQHDKLAFIFMLATLIVTLHAIRLDSPKLILPFSVLILMFVALAISTKPVAFMLPGALIVQVVLFTPEKSRSCYLRASALILVPVGYALAYIAGYLLKMNKDWLAHATGGDMKTNVLIYIRSVANIDFNGSLWLAILLFALVGLSWAHALWWYGTSIFTTTPTAKPGPKSKINHNLVLVYLCAIFFGAIVVLARARYPTSFYVLLPMFAFTASLATVAFALTVNGHVATRRSALALVSVVMIGLLSACWFNVTGSSRIGQWRAASANLAQGYDILRRSVNPKNVESVSFFFPREPIGYFHFFSAGVHDIDHMIPAFIFRTTMDVPIEDHFGEIPPTTSSQGELIAIWSDKLELSEARIADTIVFSNPAVSAWPPIYTPGTKLGFGKHSDGTQYLADGWSWEEAHGTWSDSSIATLGMKLDQPYQGPLELVVSGQSFVAKNHPRQDIEILVNEQLVGSWTFQHGNEPVELRALIPADIGSLGHLKVNFRILNPRSPASLGLAKDGRELGFFLKRLQINQL